MINVQIVEDEKLPAHSLSLMINQSEIATITGVYHNLKACRESLPKKIPDILLLDIKLPDGDGVDFCAEITKSFPDLKVIMLTSYKAFNLAKHALHNGALGYILKNSEPEEFFAGIETVNAGKQFLCEEIDLLLREKRHEKVVWLTNMEKKVLQYIVDGYTRKKIAELLFRNEETIKTHWRNLLFKLNAKNTAELVKICYEEKLI
jgi:DNA-binding NarL/FixJ family response regulator